MKSLGWPAVTYRVFAIGNVLVVLIGLLFLLPTAWSVRIRAVENVPANSNFATWFWAMTSVNLCLLALLVVGGVHLFRLRPSGVTICNAVFVGEILYFLVIGFLWSALRGPISTGLAEATGVGSVGLSPQVISGYPLVALTCLNLARRRQRKTPAPMMRTKIFIACAFLIIVVAGLVALPRIFLRIRHRFVDTTSADSLQELYTAQSEYARTHPDKGFTASLSDLDLWVDHDLLATGNKNGYTFILTASSRDAHGRVTHYSIFAVPQKYQKGTPSFYIDQSGIERFTTENRLATVSDSPIP
jgi:hypothetical protein